MLISKINMYCAQSNAFKNVSFKKSPNTSKTQNSSFNHLTEGYKGVLTYNEILAMKEYAEKSKIGNYVPNIAIEIHPDAVGNYIIVANQDEISKGKGLWLDISDYDNA